MKQNPSRPIYLPLALNKKNMKFEIDPETYEEIAKVIHSDESPVGIDAKKTHIFILYKLIQIEKRLEALEKKQF